MIALCAHGHSSCTSAACDDACTQPHLLLRCSSWPAALLPATSPQGLLPCWIGLGSLQFLLQLPPLACAGPPVLEPACQGVTIILLSHTPQLCSCQLQSRFVLPSSLPSCAAALGHVAACPLHAALAGCLLVPACIAEDRNSPIQSFAIRNWQPHKQ
jgi:hypothetical protein